MRIYVCQNLSQISFPTFSITLKFIQIYATLFKETEFLHDFKAHSQMISDSFAAVLFKKHNKII